MRAFWKWFGVVSLAFFSCRPGVAARNLRIMVIGQDYVSNVFTTSFRFHCLFNNFSNETQKITLTGKAMGTYHNSGPAPAQGIFSGNVNLPTTVKTLQAKHSYIHNIIGFGAPVQTQADWWAEYPLWIDVKVEPDTGAIGANCSVVFGIVGPNLLAMSIPVNGGRPF